MGKFITDQILGMKWLNTLIGNLLGTLGLDVTSRIGGSIQFFLYDVIKITVLLCVLIYLISYIQSYFPPERSKKIMGRFHGIWANCIAALLGTVTPFCSCSSIPLFIGFTSAGLPLGVTFSFLISSPMVDLGSLVLLMSICPHCEVPAGCFQCVRAMGYADSVCGAVRGHSSRRWYADPVFCYTKKGCGVF